MEQIGWNHCHQWTANKPSWLLSCFCFAVGAKLYYVTHACAEESVIFPSYLLPHHRGKRAVADSNETRKYLMLGHLTALRPQKLKNINKKTKRPRVFFLYKMYVMNADFTTKPTLIHLILNQYLLKLICCKRGKLDAIPEWSEIT